LRAGKGPKREKVARPKRPGFNRDRPKRERPKRQKRDNGQDEESEEEVPEVVKIITKMSTDELLAALVNKDDGTVKEKPKSLNELMIERREKRK
jgi:hypothetical protein